MKKIADLVLEVHHSDIDFNLDDPDFYTVGDASLTDLAKLDGVHVVPTVWSNGTTVRRYCGQDGGADGQSSNKSSHMTKEHGYRKMVAILVELPE